MVNFTDKWKYFIDKWALLRVRLTFVERVTFVSWKVVDRFLLDVSFFLVFNVSAKLEMYCPVCEVIFHLFYRRHTYFFYYQLFKKELSNCQFITIKLNAEIFNNKHVEIKSSIYIYIFTYLFNESENHPRSTFRCMYLLSRHRRLRICHPKFYYIFWYNDTRT